MAWVRKALREVRGSGIVGGWRLCVYDLNEWLLEIMVQMESMFLVRLWFVMHDVACRTSGQFLGFTPQPCIRLANSSA